MNSMSGLGVTPAEKACSPVMFRKMQCSGCRMSLINPSHRGSGLTIVRALTFIPPELSPFPHFASYIRSARCHLRIRVVVEYTLERTTLHHAVDLMLDGEPPGAAQAMPGLHLTATVVGVSRRLPRHIP